MDKPKHSMFWPGDGVRDVTRRYEFIHTRFGPFVNKSWSVGVSL